MRKDFNLNFEYIAKNLSINALKKFIFVLERELKEKEKFRYEKRNNTETND